MRLSEDVEYITLQRPLPLALHGYVWPFAVAYAALLGGWVWVFGALFTELFFIVAAIYRLLEHRLVPVLRLVCAREMCADM